MHEPLKVPENPTLSSLCTELGVVVAELSAPPLQEKVRALQTKINEARLNLVVLGEFKRGKSTLINALLGHAVLPVGVVPITSVVTVLQYGQVPGIRIEFDDDEPAITANLQELSRYVSETENPSNRKHVRSAVVEYPAELLESGVRIVDTPGVGSIHQHNTEVTEQFLPQADAAVFMFAADQPATEAELAFLERARQHAVKFFYVQNKSDYLAPNEKQISKTFVEQALAVRVREPVCVYQVSAKQGLTGSDVGFEELKADLLRFLGAGRLQAIDDANRRRLQSLLTETAGYLQLERMAIALPSEKLQKATEKFKAASKQLLHSLDAAEYQVIGRSQRLIAEISSTLDPFVSERKTTLESWVATQFEDKRHLPHDELRAAIVEALRDRIAEMLQPWRQEQEARIAEQFEAISHDAVREAEQISQSVSLLCQELLRTRLDIQFDIQPLSTKTRTYYAVKDPFTLSLQVLPLLLAGPFAGRLIRSRFLRASGEELVRNGVGLRADFQQRIEESVRQFVLRFRAQINQEIEQINDLLERAVILQKQTSENMSEESTRLAELSAKIDELRRRLV